MGRLEFPLSLVNPSQGLKKWCSLFDRDLDQRKQGAVKVGVRLMGRDGGGQADGNKGDRGPARLPRAVARDGRDRRNRKPGDRGRNGRKPVRKARQTLRVRREADRRRNPYGFRYLKPLGRDGGRNGAGDGRGGGKRRREPDSASRSLSAATCSFSSATREDDGIAHPLPPVTPMALRDAPRPKGRRVDSGRRRRGHRGGRPARGSGGGANGGGAQSDGVPIGPAQDDVRDLIDAARAGDTRQVHIIVRGLDDARSVVRLLSAPTPDHRRIETPLHAAAAGLRFGV